MTTLPLMGYQVITNTNLQIILKLIITVPGHDGLEFMASAIGSCSEFNNRTVESY